MPNQDTTQLKEKIIYVFKKRGPSLPVHIASETGLSTLFASAFLSELLSEKKIKLSNMKVGSSPIYLIKGQEPMLEKYSQHLKSKEKEAYELLKQKKILKDSQQVPAIRIALREIKDFAIPFKKDEEIFWRFFTVSESELEPIEKPKPKPNEETSSKKEKKQLDIFDKPKTKKTAKKKISTKSSRKQDDKFFNSIKESLTKKEIEIIDIVSVLKNELQFRVKKDNQERLLIAFNKKRILEEDLIKANKKASELEIPFIILSKGEPTKKFSTLINAIKNLSNIEKIE